METDQKDSTEKYNALKLNMEAAQGEMLLLSKLADTDLPSICYAYKSRTKSESALLEKLERKRLDKPEYNLFDITDVIGVRFVTLFRSNLPDVVESVIRLISHSIELTPNPFIKDSIGEIIAYHVPHVEDPIFDVIDDFVKEAGLEDIYTKKPTGEYSSIHIVGRLNKKVKNFSNGSDEYYVPVEIQIRTVFEDAWGEIDHKYGYTVRQGKNQVKPVNNPENVDAHLKVLKKFVDAAAQYADEISKEANDERVKKDDSGKLISVGTDNSLLARFEELGVSKQLIASYQSYRDSRIQATDDCSVPSLLIAAENFKAQAEKVYEDSEDFFQNTDNGTKLYYYYCKMNEAFCLLSSGRKNEIKIAISIYSELLKHFPDFPVLLHRYGQSHGKLGKYDEAITYCSRAWELLKSIGDDETDQLPEIERKHLEAHSLSLIGYNMWAKSNSSDSLDDREKLELIDQACTVTTEALKHDQADRSKIYNNLLYYKLDLLNRFPQEASEEVDNEIEDLLNNLEQVTDIDELTDLDQLDTLSKAYFKVGNYKNAKIYAEKIMSQSLDNTHQEVDSTVVLEIVQEAWQLIHQIKCQK
ncbi:hypothetical protein ACMXYX_01095 [Neptuniibacter sp. QD72_48]|uniref:hypothetical protein n=1 Tax=Neptuniibacter sp. QD72_48 TaxID=3398214 RepID=UPI0039F55899